MSAHPAARLFYTLPYQASMNAMYLRLAREVLAHDDADIKAGRVETITIRHSRALLTRYQLMMELDERDPAAAQTLALRLRDKTTLNTYPIQVFSPYQMLKAAYALKGHEALLLDYTGGIFIFDEIHAYEPERLALIITLMRWLLHGFGARFLVMTATLPSMLRTRLLDALDATVIDASPREYRRSRRHTVHLIDAVMSAVIVQRVRADLASGKAVLVCLNQIASAQAVYRLLREALGLQADEDIVLLHGRFNGADRRRKEAILLERVGVGQRDRRPFVCVATQVVEVSLNVDFDTLYSDPAPLEALLQRFGRVNRGRGASAPLLPVQVFTQPSNQHARHPHMPYDADAVERGIAVLRAAAPGDEGKPIDEADVTRMLDSVYTGDLLARWEAAYEQSAGQFQRDILGAMQPFTSGEAGRFYAMFDGIEVLPIDSLDAYDDAREQRGFLEASQYLVNIPYRLYGEFFRYGLITPAKKLAGDFADHIHVPYDRETGLDIDGARRAQHPTPLDPDGSDPDGSENEGD